LRSLQRFPRPLTVFEESNSKRGERERGKKGKGKVKGTKGEKRWRDLTHPKILAWHPYARPLAGFRGPWASKGTPGDAKCVTVILRGPKIRKLRDKV